MVMNLENNTVDNILAILVFFPLDSNLSFLKKGCLVPH